MGTALDHLSRHALNGISILAGKLACHFQQEESSRAGAWAGWHHSNELFQHGAFEFAGAFRADFSYRRLGKRSSRLASSLLVFFCLFSLDTVQGGDLEGGSRTILESGNHVLDPPPEKAGPGTNAFLDSDTTPPRLLWACMENNGRDIRVVFSEEVTGNLDKLLFHVTDEEGTVHSSTTRTIIGRELLMEGMVDAFSGVELPLVGGLQYSLVIIAADPPAITDLFGNALEPTGVDPIYGTFATVVPVCTTVSFQQGVNGYVETVDTEIRGNNPDADLSGNTTVTMDGEDEGLPVHGLLRFDNLLDYILIDSYDSDLINAELKVWTSLDSDGEFGIHQMLIPWESSDTWNSLGGDGVQADGVEASVTADDLITPGTTNGLVTIDVTGSVQDWFFFPHSNYGWVILSADGTDGWSIASSEAVEVGHRPRLVVRYMNMVIEFGGIVRHPEDATVQIGEEVSLSVVASGGRLSYQWRRNGELIAGATNAVYTIPFVLPGHAGSYDVLVSNPTANQTSDVAELTVEDDGIPPYLVSVSANGDRATITLVFSEPIMATVESFSIEDDLGGVLEVNEATVQANRREVILDVERPMMDRCYTFAIRDVTDLSLQARPLEPIPTSLAYLNFVHLLVDFDAIWSYHTNGMPDSAEVPVPGWETSDFDDSNWPTGRGLFGLEPSAGVIPAELAIHTPFGLGNNFSDFNSAYYFRSSFTLPVSTDKIGLLRIDSYVDDGAIFYLNGTRAGHVEMPPDLFPSPVAYTNLLVEGDDVSFFSTMIIPTLLVEGENSIAVEVHQGGASSSDILFGAQIHLILGPCLTHPPHPELTIEQTPSQVILTWPDLSWKLLAAPTADGEYREVVEAASPYHLEKPISPEMQFFQLRCLVK